MLQRPPINVSRVLLSLSDALDLCSPQLASHQLRTAYISLEIGRAMGLSERRLAGLFATATLHDIGALTTSHKCTLHAGETERVECHVRIGEILFDSIPLLRPWAQVVRHHHTPYDELDGTMNDSWVVDSQIIQAADILERKINRNVFILHQNNRIMDRMELLSATVLHTDIIDIIVRLGRKEEFWLDIVSPRLYSNILRHGPYDNLTADRKNLFQIATLFRSIIDYRSHFTATHSTGVMQCAKAMAQRFGMSRYEVESMELAGSFHDLGKLVVPNEILEKPGGLDHDEFAVMRQHTYWTLSLMNSMGGMEQMAEWAAFHHERLDGSGYPFHLTGDNLSVGARIMAVADISTAVIEDRPYRKGMDKEKVAATLKSFSDRKLIDTHLTHLFMDNYDEIHGEVIERQGQAMAFYRAEIEELERSQLI